MHFPVRRTSRRACIGFNRFPAFFSVFILCRIRTVGNAAARFTAFIIYCCTVQVSYAQRREHQAPPVFAACFAEQYAQRAILSRRIDRFPVLFFRKTEFADGKLRKVERPKKKNPLHLQKTLTTVELAEITNKKLRSALSVLNRSADNIAEESDKLV